LVRSLAKSPDRLFAVSQWINIPEAQGSNWCNFVAIRDVVDSAVEKAVQYKGKDYEKEAKRILDDAAKECNNILREYIQLYGD
jgi:sn-glycerol 3-phosphate transport system substrate-binding protein